MTEWGWTAEQALAAVAKEEERQRIAKIEGRAVAQRRGATASNGNGHEAPPWVPAEVRNAKRPAKGVMRSKRASEIAPTRVTWLWPRWLPAARVSLFGGKPEEGKSGVSIYLAARFSTGSPLPDGYQPAAPLTIVLLSGEDDPSDTLVPRLMAAGASLERVIIANGTIVDSETGLARPWILPNDIPELAQLVRKHDADLVIIDPLGAFVSIGVDTHRDAAVRSMLLPLSQMARRERCGVLGIRHHRKGGAADARDAGGGSIAFTAAARIEWVAGRDPQDADRHVLAVSKSNLAKKPGSLAYRMVSADDEWDTVRIAWDGPSALTVDQLVAEPSSEEDRSVVDEAVEFLSATLAEGPVPSKDIERQARDAGMSYPALRRAKIRLKIRSRKTPLKAWVWELRDQGARARGEGAHEGAQTSGGAHLEHLEHVEHLPSTHTLSSEGNTCESVEGAQGAQGDQWRNALADEPLDDWSEDLERQAIIDDDWGPPLTDDDMPPEYDEEGS